MFLTRQERIREQVSREQVELMAVRTARDNWLYGNQVSLDDSSFWFW